MFSVYPRSEFKFKHLQLFVKVCFLTYNNDKCRQPKSSSRTKSHGNKWKINMPVLTFHNYRSGSAVNEVSQCETISS